MPAESLTLRWLWNAKCLVDHGSAPAASSSSLKGGYQNDVSVAFFDCIVEWTQPQLAPLIEGSSAFDKQLEDAYEAFASAMMESGFTSLCERILPRRSRSEYKGTNLAARSPRRRRCIDIA